MAVGAALTTAPEALFSRTRQRGPTIEGEDVDLGANDGDGDGDGDGDDDDNDNDDDRGRPPPHQASQHVSIRDRICEAAAAGTARLLGWLSGWLRATTAAMRPDALKELLWNGLSFVSERFLHHAPADSTETRQAPASDSPSSRHDLITVDRIKPPAAAAATATATTTSFSQDYELVWRDGPRDYISAAGFEAIASLLQAWRDDLVAGNVTRCPYPQPVVRRFDDDDDDDGRHAETRLSVVVHNFMFARSGENTEQAWQDAVVEFLTTLEATERWISLFYAPDAFASMKAQGVVPYAALSAAMRAFWGGESARCGLCAVGDFLAFAIRETHQWGHRGMDASQRALMQLLVDLEAFHHQQPVLSFVLVERQSRPPGYLFDDADGAVESVTADELRNRWLSGGRSASSASSATSATSATVARSFGAGVRRRGDGSTCRLHSDDAALAVRSPEAVRRARIVSAAAASLRAARRSADGSGALRIAPSRPLLFERYRRTSSEAGTRLGPAPARDSSSSSSSSSSSRRLWDALPAAAGVETYRIPAKRKAKTATPDPRLAKLRRLGAAASAQDSRPKDKQQAKTEAEASAALAAAASIPLPPSPAATEMALDESEVDMEDAAEAAAAAAAAVLVDTVQQQRRRLWTLVFPEDESDESDATPRLRISAAKAEELRLLAEKKRATQEAARLKREAEKQRREAERLRKEEEERAKSAGLRAPTRRVIAALPEGWRARLAAAVRADPGKDVAKSPEGTGLKSKDFRTVVSKSEWLNDEIVNGFLLHLANYINGRAGIVNTKTQTPKCHAFTSFFWKPLSTRGAAGTERWMKRVGVTRDNFLQIETILIPICESNHWTLVVVRPGRGTVTHMDSLGSRGGGRRAVTDAVLRWLREVLRERFAEAAWRVQHVDSPRQTNGWDCGVHAVTNALFVSLGLDPACYGAMEMPVQRDRIAATLLNGGFSGDLDLGGV